VPISGRDLDGMEISRGVDHSTGRVKVKKEDDKLTS